ncbi:transketolase C-terminal domain-containing protein [uncultured Thermanaerothrix sp.]|uniref:transketolase family protein n=1 Tax=uncultured Thermanaerothrix sp. TaxID=1195149 RepID=UPI002602CB88|nr:transketolase C-terminal domain-containing protein [uncultured Thermanaerothrix sp.]
MNTLELGKPNQDVVAEILSRVARQDPDIVVVTGDSRGSAKMTGFGKEFPDKLVEVGIAEQNLVGIAAGLASTGKKVFAFSPACFLTARSLEQIKNDVAYSDQPVRLVGISAGVSYGALGGTHHSLHDLAALQAINNIDIVVPADNFETAQAILQAVDYGRPIYLRFGKRPVYHLHGPSTPFKIGNAIPIREGRDVTFIAMGETVAPAVLASYLLEENGISCGVVSFHTLRPFDKGTLFEVAASSRALITVEEHSVYGGLGSTVAAILMEAGLFRPFKRVGIPDEYIVTGSQEEIFNHYGITPGGLAQTALALLEASHQTFLYVPERLDEQLRPDAPSD